jgi:hypothetical protein
VDVVLGVGDIEVDFGAGGRVGGEGESRECLEARREECSVTIGAFGDDSRSDRVDLIEVEGSLSSGDYDGVDMGIKEKYTSKDVLHGAPLRIAELTQDVCLASVAKMEAAAVR